MEGIFVSGVENVNQQQYGITYTQLNLHYFSHVHVRKST